MFSVDELKKLRKESGLTQAKVAKLTNFSQSLISQIEAGDVDPRLSTINKIYNVITHYKNKRQKRALDIMQRGIISISPNDNLSNAIKLMKNHEVSQLPVIENEKIVGSVSDSVILTIMDREPNLDLKYKKVEEVMEDPFPLISANAPIKSITQLLRKNSALLVTHMGSLEGIITKVDLFNVHKI